MLGLAGMILLVSADTNDVKATGKISYESETVQEDTFMTAGILASESAERAVAEMQELLPEETQSLARAGEIPREESGTEGEEQAAEEEAAAEQPPEAEPAEEQTPNETETAETPEAAEETESISSGRIYEISGEDYDALLRLVEAEASGEDIKGKMLVANVVLNRVKSSSFPDTVKEVIYQKENGRAQFSPVATGKIDRVSVSGETVEAVERVLCGEDESAGALYFVAPAYASAENRSWFENNLTLLFSYKGHQFYA